MIEYLYHLVAFLLTWFNYSQHGRVITRQYGVGWNCLSIPKPQRLQRWSLRSLTNNGCIYLCIMGSNLDYISKRGPLASCIRLNYMILNLTIYDICYIIIYLPNQHYVFWNGFISMFDFGDAAIFFKIIDEILWYITAYWSFKLGALPKLGTYYVRTCWFVSANIRNRTKDFIRNNEGHQPYCEKARQIVWQAHFLFIKVYLENTTVNCYLIPVWSTPLLSVIIVVRNYNKFHANKQEENLAYVYDSKHWIDRVT